MAVSNYFTDEDLEAQLRLHFSEEEQWDIDFKVFFNHIEDLGPCLYLSLRGRGFQIDKVTGGVVEINPKNNDEEEET